jgi:hypothetical protein
MSTIILSNIKATGETASRAVSGVAAMWARFDMSSASIDDSLNLGSLTDNGTGDFTFNFTNNMASANYAHVGSGSLTTGTTTQVITSTLKDGSSSYSSSSSFRGEIYYANSVSNRTNFDYDYVTGTIHGDLA